MAFLTIHPASALQEAYGHVELSPHYHVGTGTWNWKTYWFDGDLNERQDPVETLYFPGLDSPTAGYGVRNLRPADSKWDFLGMMAGEPVWIFSESSYASAGFAATQVELSGDIIFRLDSVTGPPGGNFSMYSGIAPNIYMQTLNGIGTTDEFKKPLNHAHVNWAFSRKGLWIIYLKAQGTVRSTATATNQSPPEPIVFAIGDYARWKAANFDLAELINQEISGDLADPDADGTINLMEYALGGNPRIASAMRTLDSSPITPLLLPPATKGAPWKFCYFRRIAEDVTDIAYSLQSSTTLAVGSWTDETGIEETLPLDATWQKVTISLTSPPTENNARFLRLEVSLIH